MPPRRRRPPSPPGRRAASEVALLPDADGKVDLAAALRDLAARGINELHVEAGEKLNGSLARAGLVDEWLVYVAPRLIGDGRGLAALGTLARLDDALALRFRRRRARRRRPAPAAAPRRRALSAAARRLTPWRRPARAARQSAHVHRHRQRLGRIASVEPLGAGSPTSATRPACGSPSSPAGYTDDVRTGDSIAIDGACMTLTAFDARRLQRRRLGREPVEDRRPRPSGPGQPREGAARRRPARWPPGQRPRRRHRSRDALRAGRRVVAAAGRAPRALARFLAVKGSIAVDGVSLTVNRVEDAARRLRVQRQPDPPHAGRTTLGAWRSDAPSTSRST